MTIISYRPLPPQTHSYGLMDYLNSGDVVGACEDIPKRYKKEHLRKLAGYIRHGIWYKEARDKGISLEAGSADKAGDILICRGMKLRGM